MIATFNFKCCWKNVVVCHIKDTNHITCYFLCCAVSQKFVVITKRLSILKGLFWRRCFFYKRDCSIIRRSNQQNCYFVSGQVCKFTATPLSVLQGVYTLHPVLLVNILWIMLTPYLCPPLSTKLDGLWSQCVNWIINFTSLWSASCRLLELSWESVN